MPPTGGHASLRRPDRVLRYTALHKAAQTVVRMALVRQLSNPSGPLKTLLDQARWDAQDATELIPAPRPCKAADAIGAQHPRAGWVVEAVERVLAAHDGPMQARAVHAAVEALLGRSVSWSSVKNALADHALGSSPRFVRVARGRYRLR